MQQSVFFKLAASSLIFGATMAGCASTGTGTRSASASGVDQAAKLAGAAEEALQGDDTEKAVTGAEATVSVSPNDGKYRSLLGQAYLSAGRFASAEASFQDALTLGHVDARTVIGLAMVQIASGKGEDARALLGNHMEVLPAADYGLAMALAGDAEEGLRILSAEARQPDATPKVRQNLAYTLALAGRWRESKLVASQDLSPADAAKRIGEWAVLARPGGEMQQIAHLIGITPEADPGMPTRLALGQSGAPVQTASVELPAPQVENGVSSAPIAETQVAMTLSEAVPGAAPVPVPAMISAPVFVPASAPAMIPVPVPAARTSVAARASGYIVQLGAFSSAEGVNRAWRSISNRYRNMDGLATLASRAQVKGKVFHRLALSGFDNRAEAEKICASIKAKGSVCFVRNIGGEASRWVSRDIILKASRSS